MIFSMPDSMCIMDQAYVQFLHDLTDPGEFLFEFAIQAEQG